MIFDRNVSIKCRVAARKATKSMHRIDSIIKQNMETLALYRNAQASLTSTCERLLKDSGYVQQPAKPTPTVMVEKVAAIELPKITMAQPKTQIKSQRVNRCRAASTNCYRSMYQKRDMNPQPAHLPKINKPTL